jgi:hypothetical protein
VSTVAAGPTARAERLLQDVLGETQFQRLTRTGYLDLPSGLVQGRVYRLDSAGNLSYRDPGETTFHTSLCVQPRETIPKDDMVAMRYLLVTADEERLLKVANPIAFGFFSLARTLYHDYSQNHPAWMAALFTICLLGFFLGALVVEGWLALHLFPINPLFAVMLGTLALVPAFIGIVLIAAAVAEAVRTVRVWRGRLRLRAGAKTR